MNLISILKGKSLGQIYRGFFRFLKTKIEKFCLYITPPAKNGISGNTNFKVVVSLTSFPKRIKKIHLCIKTLLNQTYKPDAVLLWLAIEQFPNKESDLPKKLLRLCNNGLTIRWCNDIKSYKKLIPTIKEYPEAVIITTDDDVYYKKDWLKGLIEAHKKNPKDVCCYRGAKIGFECNEFVRYPICAGSHYSDATYLHQQTGVGGVLYPSNSFVDEILNEDVFMDIANTNDDLWFWLMGALNGTKVRLVGENNFKLYYIGKTQLYSLTSINDQGEQLYYKQLKAIFERYPETLKILKQEFEAISKSNMEREV